MCLTNSLSLESRYDFASFWQINSSLFKGFFFFCSYDTTVVKGFCQSEAAVLVGITLPVTVAFPSPLPSPRSEECCPSCRVTNDPNLLRTEGFPEKKRFLFLIAGTVPGELERAGHPVFCHPVPALHFLPWVSTN